MIANLLRARGNRQLIEALHGAVVAAARRPALFLPPYEVPDTLEGRFDLLVLFSLLVARRLESLPAPGPEIAQDLVDTLFSQLDSNLREMGVGDFGVPKRMKRLAEAFWGRSAAYRGALGKDEPAFAAAIARNIYGREVADAAANALLGYCRQLTAELDQADLAQILAEPSFPDPEAIHVRAR
jgi:cytochrome b pre-mRNA-processing protein 3